jgi:hypothetical protein
MDQDQFQQALRGFLHREPFFPFVIVLREGQSIVVDQPAVAFAGGAGVFITPTHDLQGFKCEDVQGIRLATQEAAS